MTCPVCNARLWMCEMVTNHEPVFDHYGLLAGYKQGVPDATFRCGMGCEIKTRGAENVERLRVAAEPCW